jgi:cyclic-di-GMP-binding protein
MTDPHLDPCPADAVGADAATRPPDRPPPLFVDAEGAARWVKTLSVTDVNAACAAVLEQLHALAALDLPPRERARVAEVLRQQVAYLHTELARRYAGKPQPAGERDREPAEQAIALWQALWEQYSACLKPLLEGDPGLERVKAKLLQRGLHVGKQLVLVYGLARRLPPAALWPELHAYYRLVEMLECAADAVSDPLLPNGVGISCYSTYSHALLLALADPCAMSIKQIQLADRWLEMWARKVHPATVKRDTEGPVILVDLDAAAGATLSAVAPAEPAASLRYAYADKLAASVRGRLKRLQTGANPAELQLGHDCSVEQCTTLLSYLDWRWYQPPRQVAAGAPSALSLCSGGLDAAYFRIGGRTFDRRGPLRPFGPQSAQHLAALDALTDYDRGRDKAERTWAWERWEGACEWREASLTRCEGAHYRWHLEQLVVVDDGERLRAGYVTRVALGENDELALALRLWSGAPKALALRPASGTVAEVPPMPALLLAETPDDKPCLVLPPRTFNPGRVLRAADAGPERRYRLTRLLQRGADFERIAFEQQK